MWIKSINMRLNVARQRQQRQLTMANYCLVILAPQMSATLATRLHAYEYPAD